jgi:hypothetical protein
MRARLPGVLGLPRAQRLPRQDRAGPGSAADCRHRLFAQKQELAAPGLETKRNGQLVGMTSSREWLGSGAASIAAGILLIRGHLVDSGASGTGASVAGLSMVLAAHLIMVLVLIGIM